jgi:hypothetical protein
LQCPRWRFAGGTVRKCTFAFLAVTLYGMLGTAALVLVLAVAVPPPAAALLLVVVLPRPVELLTSTGQHIRGYSCGTETDSRRL